VSLKFDEWSFVVRVVRMPATRNAKTGTDATGAQAGSVSLTTMIQEIMSHMSALETSQCVALPLRYLNALALGGIGLTRAVVVGMVSRVRKVEAAYRVFRKCSVATWQGCITALLGDRKRQPSESEPVVDDDGADVASSDVDLEVASDFESDDDEVKLDVESSLTLPMEVEDAVETTQEVAVDDLPPHQRLPRLISKYFEEVARMDAAADTAASSRTALAAASVLAPPILCPEVPLPFPNIARVASAIRAEARVRVMWGVQLVSLPTVLFMLCRCVVLAVTVCAASRGQRRPRPGPR